MKNLHNHSFDNCNINVLNMKIVDDNNIDKYAKIKKSLLENDKATETNSSKLHNYSRNISGNSQKYMPSQSCNDVHLNLLNNEVLNNSINKNINVIENSKSNSISLNNTKEGNKIIKSEKNKKKKILNKIITKNNSQNNIFLSPNIKKSDIEFNKSNYIDKSVKNWGDVKNKYFDHIKNQEAIKKLEKENLSKKQINNKYRKFYFGRQRIYGMPYYYDISSTYMNDYYNKSEHKRHEILIDEISKLRAYLQKYPNKNNVEIIKDFLNKHNIQNIDKLTNYQLIQLGKFVCQEDIYKTNSLLKPYMNVKDMIYDILQNSLTLNNRFGEYKFKDSIEKLLKRFNISYINSNNIFNYYKKRINSSLDINPKNNKKFYISELDYNDNTESLLNNINNMINEDEKIIENNNEEKSEEAKEKENDDFITYSKKRKEILDSIGIVVNKKPNNEIFKDQYISPLIKTSKNKIKKDSEIYYNEPKINIKKIKDIKLPKIKNKVLSYYKPNKLLLAPDKNYSSNFSSLLKDISGELKNFENLYKQQFDMATKRNLSLNNNIKKNNIKPLKISQSLKRLDNNNVKKKIEDMNKLYYGKSNIKLELNDIQKKNKLTEYIALANAKKHINIEIIKNMDFK